MHGNWHMFGDKGYYDASGYYYEDVTDATIGFFNEVGEFTVGYNPYVNGYNDVNGNWSDSFTMPLTTYYEKDGTVRVGNNPYKDGYYDMYANWHRYRDKGYFDKHGTYYSLSNSVAGYYDAKGNYLEGTNPYQHGYYDEDGNMIAWEKYGNDDYGCYGIIESYFADGVAWTEQTYWDDGSLKSETNHNLVKGKSVYFYDESGNCTRWEKYYPNGQMEFWYEYVADKSEHYYENGQLRVRSEGKYEIYYYEDGRLQSDGDKRYHYNDDGTYIVGENGTQYLYDKDGNLLGQCSYN
jgi:hypothetical protein